MWIIRARRCPKTIDALFQWIEPRCPKTHDSNPHAIYFSSFPCSCYITVFVWAKCFQIRHFSSEDVEGGASWKKIFLFPRPLEADWHDELCNHLFAKLKVIWISCCADSLWPKMGEAWRKSKLSWGADTGAGESGYNRDYNQDNRDYNSVANRNYSWRSRSRNDCWPINGWRDQKRSACQGPWLKGVDSAHRGEQRCLLVWNSNSYI